MFDRDSSARVTPSETPSPTLETGDVPNCNSQIFRGPRGRASFTDFKQVTLDIISSHEKLFAHIANICVVLVSTVVLTKVFAYECLPEDTDATIADADVFCDPFYPLERIVVDIDLNTTSHCYSSRSCVALGERLRQDQGKFRYNFIIGAYGFIYAQHGYTCQSEALEDAVYIRLPVDSIYNGQDFMAARKAVNKFNELLREGLECGKILKNYTITATGCGKFNDWCTKMLYELMAEDPTDRGASGARIDYYDKIQPGSFFNPLNLNRVYSYQYKLVVCTQVTDK